MLQQAIAKILEEDMEEDNVIAFIRHPKMHF